MYNTSIIIQKTELSRACIIYKTRAISRFAQFWLTWSHGGRMSDQKLHSNRCSASKSAAGQSSSRSASPVCCESGAPLLLQQQQGTCAAAAAPAGSKCFGVQPNTRQTDADRDASNTTLIKLRWQTVNHTIKVKLLIYMKMTSSAETVVTHKGFKAQKLKSK